MVLTYFLLDEMTVYFVLTAGSVTDDSTIKSIVL